MKYEVCFLMSGSSYMPLLIVALKTLRQHYDGVIRVSAWNESYPIVAQIAEDSRLNIIAQHRQPEYTGKNSQFIQKIQLMQEFGCDVRLYLDADIVVQGDVMPLIHKAYEKGFVTTQFNRWTTAGSTIKGRLARLLGHGLNDSLIQQVIDSETHPSVNGGIFACRPESPVLPLWHKWAWETRDIFISDECALHIMPDLFPNDCFIWEGGEYNGCHKYFPKQKSQELIIVHNHGNSCLRWNKSHQAVLQWYPLFCECQKENLGNIKSWLPKIKNKYLEELERDIANATITVAH